MRYVGQSYYVARPSELDMGETETAHVSLWSETPHERTHGADRYDVNAPED
jgi:hypothetical protein